MTADEENHFLPSNCCQNYAKSDSNTFFTDELYLLTAKPIAPYCFPWYTVNKKTCTNRQDEQLRTNTNRASRFPPSAPVDSDLVLPQYDTVGEPWLQLLLGSPKWGITIKWYLTKEVRQQYQYAGEPGHHERKHPVAQSNDVRLEPQLFWLLTSKRRPAILPLLWQPSSKTM